MKNISILCAIILAINLLNSCSKREQIQEKKTLLEKSEIMSFYLKAYETNKETKYKGLEACHATSIFEQYKLEKNKLLVHYFSEEDFSDEKEILYELIKKLNIATDLDDGIYNYYIFNYNEKILEEVIRSLPSGYNISTDDIKIFIGY